MGFLSRKTNEEESGAAETPAEQEQAPEAVSEPTPPEPDDAEIKVTEKSSNGGSGNGDHPPAAEDVRAEEDLSEDAAEDVQAEEASAENVRMQAKDLIAPSRHQGPDEEAEQVAGAKVFSFANQKGGVAKTTTTLNLAVAFSESGHRVLCIDLDPQGNLTMSQGIDPDKVEKSMY
ncbi:MAG: AAA family ATPase, partial [Actinomycetota bacterium]